MKISVIIPTFNRRGKIAAAIDSTLSQVGVELEVIVVDDGSSDYTRPWLEQAYAGQGLLVLSNKGRKGPAGARNTGILASTGELVAFLDSDDFYLPGHLQEAHELLRSDTEIGLVFGRSRYECNGEVVDYMGPNFEKKLGQAPTVLQTERHRKFSVDYTDHLLEYGCYFSLCTVVMRAGAAAELMNEDLRVAEDYEFWVRLSRTHRFACLHRQQSCSVLHDGNISFETQTSAAQHAPSQLAAYEFMLNYPALTPKQIALIKNKMAEVLFDWGYRCRLRQEWREAARLHWRALRLGLVRANLAALLKLPLVAVLRGQTRPGTY
jgi:glycosyltransferase involved in cell wall biosynthesis